MSSAGNKMNRNFQLLGGLIGWTAILLQLYVTLENRQVSVLYSLIRFFSYFTILTNTLVAINFTALWLFPLSSPAAFFKKYTTTTAIMVYILVVGIIYNVLLRGIWPVSGLGKLADELLHSFIPLFYWVYWFFIAERKKLFWKNAIYWMGYPVVYLVYTLFRGTITHTYPYPFIDVNVLGYQQVIVNCIGVGVLFYLLFILSIGVTRLISKEEKPF